MKIKIETLLGINDCTLAIYSYSDQEYRFSVVSMLGKAYTCDSSFPTLSSAKSVGIAIVERFSCKPWWFLGHIKG